MPAFSCADESRQAKESPIGSAAHHAAYVVLECPPPWPSDDLSAPPIPKALRQLSHSLTPSGQRVRWLLVHAPHDPPSEGVRLWVFQRPSGLAGGYHQQAFQVPSLEAAAPVIQAALRGQPVTDWQVANTHRELLICTHGSHDRCCGRYGLPFYRQAVTLLPEAQQQHLRIWQASHFSGHRFAPTVLTFPDGRYYGRLNLAALRRLINRRGNLQTLMPCYRGWGILPDPVQVFERDLWLRHGWAWLEHRIQYKILAQTPTHTEIELVAQSPTGGFTRYGGVVAADCQPPLLLHGECSSRPNEVYEFPQFELIDPVSIVPTTGPAC